MATTRTANAFWEGSLADGSGRVSLDSSGLGTFDVTWPSRAEDPGGRTSPEELIAAAHATCFSMALSHALAGQGNPPASVDTKADVNFEAGTGITSIDLMVRASVPGITAQEFAGVAETAKDGCPVSQALAGTTINLDAALL